MFIPILAFVLLACTWALGDMEFRIKVLFTLLYAASWALLFVNGAALIVAQVILCIVMGYMTFGADFLRRRIR
jgi:hypothetical protein